MYRKGNNNYIPRVAKCVLESMDVDYAPGEKFTTLKPDDQGASPCLLYTPPETKFNYQATYTAPETGMLGGIIGADHFTQM